MNLSSPPLSSTRVALAALQAMLGEVWVTPKPGLVDRSGRSAHADMTLATFVRSSLALVPYFQNLAAVAADLVSPARAGRGSGNQMGERVGQGGRDVAAAAELIRPTAAEVAVLRALGRVAEERMLAATGGVNTQKGIVFLGGLLVLAWRSHEATGMPLPQAVSRWAECLLPDEPLATHGAAVRARYRVSGIIGEARTGMPTVFATMLPMYCSVRRRGWSRDLAGALALLAGVARCEDTTILHRHGPAIQADVAAEAAGLTKDWQIARPEELYARLRALDERWSAARISPGGSADLLCMTLYVLRLRSAAGRSGPHESQ